VVKSCLPMLNHKVGNRSVRIVLRFNSFQVGGPFSSSWSGGVVS
jgi:hypothetical protein